MTTSRLTMGVFALTTAAAGLFAGAVQSAAQTPSPYATVVADLRATAQLLNQADHDYKGHRAKAVREIHLAIHILHPNKKNSGTTNKNVINKNANGTPKEPQAASDAQLKQALQRLQTIQGQLNNNAPAQAIAAVREAINQLNVALSIR